MDQSGGRALFVSEAEEGEARGGGLKNFKERPLVQHDLISCFASLAHSQKAYRKIMLTNYLTGNENLEMQ